MHLDHELFMYVYATTEILLRSVGKWGVFITICS